MRIHLTTLVGQIPTPVVVQTDATAYFEKSTATNRKGTRIHFIGNTASLYVEESFEEIQDLETKEDE